MEPEMDSSTRSYKGIIIFVASLILGVSNNIVIKELFHSSAISSLDFSCFSSASTIIIFGIYGAVTKSTIISVPKPSFFTLCLRSLTACWNIIIFYICLQITPLSILSVIVNMSPLFMQMMSGCMLGETITFIDLIGTIVSFVGVCIIMLNGRNDGAASNWSGILVYLLPLVSAFNISLIYIFTKKLTTSKVASISMGMAVCSMNMMFHPLASFISKQRPMERTGVVFSKQSIVMIAISCLLGSSSFITFLESFKYEKAQRLGTISYISVVLYFITDIFFYHERITMREIIGSILIIGSSLTVTLNPQRGALISPMKTIPK